MYIKANIIEYDIRSANINVMFSSGMIDKDLYNELKEVDKKTRVVTIGKMMGEDRNLYDNYILRLEQHVNKFIEENNLEDNIIEIVKDAVWVYNIKARKRDYGEYIKFIPKRKATSALGIKNIKFYYDSTDDRLFSRGLGDIDPDVFTFLKRIKYFMSLKESGLDELLYKTLHEYHLKYLRDEIEEESDKYSVRHKEESISKSDSNYDLIEQLIENMI